jgi:hypothetical protein
VYKDLIVLRLSIISGILTKMCLNEIYNEVRTGKHLSDTFPYYHVYKRL